MAVDEHAVVGNLVGSWPGLWELVQLHAAGRVEPRSAAYPLEAANDVLTELRAGAVTGRAVLVPNEH